MRRRKFLLLPIFAVPLSTFARFKQVLREKKGIKVAAGEDRFNEPVRLGANMSVCKVSAHDTDGDIAVFESIGNSKGGPPLHVHPDQDEIFCILEGEFLFQVGEEKFEVKAGDTLFAPRSVPHAFTKTGEKPGKMLITYQPAGKMEAFYRKVGSFKQMPSAEEYAKVFEEHGMKIVGPRLSVK
jgi:quercetin 2,3-dioxygenase